VDDRGVAPAVRMSLVTSRNIHSPRSMTWRGRGHLASSALSTVRTTGLRGDALESEARAAARAASIILIA
jgi:hypothetical protein